MNRYNESKALAHEVDDLLRSPGMWDRFRQQLEHFQDSRTRWEQENAEALRQRGEVSRLLIQTPVDRVLVTVDADGNYPRATPSASEKRKLPQELLDLFATVKQEYETRVQREFATGVRPKCKEGDPRPFTTGDLWGCVRQILEARMKECAPTEPSPWARLLAVPEESETEHLTEMMEFFYPTEGFPLIGHADALCLHYVRLAILHDMALRGDGAMQSLTAGILDPHDVEGAYEQMTRRDRGGDSWDSWRTAIDQALKAVTSVTLAGSKAQVIAASSEGIQLEDGAYKILRRLAESPSRLKQADLTECQKPPMSRSVVSRHLETLRNHGLIEYDPRNKKGARILSKGRALLQ